MSAIKPRKVWKVKGGPKVYDFRGTGLCGANGGTIRPLVYVQHIPVIRNVKGLDDLYALARVLNAQGLAVQNGTDAEGNVFLFTKMNQLCYQARGANSLSTGTEHMHYSTGERWPEAQLRAAAYLAAHAHLDHGIPLHRGRLLPGGGVVRVSRRGHVTHEDVSAKAGYHDRSDPGELFEAKFSHLFELARYYEGHRRF